MYILAGIEGFAHDEVVLETAFEKDFHISSMKYYLEDIDYDFVS